MKTTFERNGVGQMAARVTGCRKVVAFALAHALCARQVRVNVLPEFKAGETFQTAGKPCSWTVLTNLEQKNLVGAEGTLFLRDRARAVWAAVARCPTVPRDWIEPEVQQFLDNHDVTEWVETWLALAWPYADNVEHPDRYGVGDVLKGVLAVYGPTGWAKLGNCRVSAVRACGGMILTSVDIPMPQTYTLEAGALLGVKEYLPA